MIFVTVGTMSYPFSRLIDKVIDIYRDKPKERVVIQSGVYIPKNLPPNISATAYFSLKETFKYYSISSVVISAPGEVSFIEVLARAHGKVIFTPRLEKYKEHVDNQQEELGEYIQKKHLATVILDFALLAEAIESVKSIVKTKNIAKNAGLDGITDFLDSITT